MATRKQLREQAKLDMDKLAVPMNAVVDRQMALWHAAANPFEAWAMYFAGRGQRAKVTKPWLVQKKIYDANAPARKRTDE